MTHTTQKKLVSPLSFSEEMKFGDLVCTIVETKPKRLELVICYEKWILKIPQATHFRFFKSLGL